MVIEVDDPVSILAIFNLVLIAGPVMSVEIMNRFIRSEAVDWNRLTGRLFATFSALLFGLMLWLNGLTGTDYTYWSVVSISSLILNILIGYLIILGIGLLCAYPLNWLIEWLETPEVDDLEDVY